MASPGAARVLSMVTPNSCPVWDMALTCTCSGAALATVDTQMREPKSTESGRAEKKIEYRKLGLGVSVQAVSSSKPVYYSILGPICGCVGEWDRVSRKLSCSETQQISVAQGEHRTSHTSTQWPWNSESNLRVGRVGFLGSEAQLLQGPGHRPSLALPNTVLVSGWELCSFSLQQGHRECLGSAQSSTATTKHEPTISWFLPLFS